MKVHLVDLGSGAYESMVQLHANSEPKLHILVDDPAEADVILFVGEWRAKGEGLLDNPLPRLYPEKCFVYFDADGFVTLLPGIYTNAETSGWLGRFLGRAESQMFTQALNPRVDSPLPVEKKYLFSFMGGSTSLLRKKLYKVKFKREDVVVENTSTYYHWDPTQPGREARQQRFADVIAASQFGLCPRGASAGGLRLFEVMQMGVAPVIISDKLMLPEGPDWERFAIRVPERKIGELDTILAGYAHESAERGRLARLAYEQWFAPPVVFNYGIAACERIRARRRVPERWIHPFWGFMLWKRRAKGAARGMVKKAALAVFRLMGKKFVYELNER
jgi:Exostosin family